MSLPVVKGIVHGPDVVIVPAKALPRATGTGGVKASLRQLDDAGQAGYKRAVREAERRYEEGSEVVRHGLSTARHQAQQIAERLKEASFEKIPDEAADDDSAEAESGK